MDGWRVLISDFADVLAIGAVLYLMIAVYRLQDRVAAVERQALILASLIEAEHEKRGL